MSALRLDMFLAHEAALVSGLRAVGRAMFHEAAEWDELRPRPNRRCRLGRRRRAGAALGG
jgi:hypothetical protein